MKQYTAADIRRYKAILDRYLSNDIAYRKLTRTQKREYANAKRIVGQS